MKYILLPLLFAAAYFKLSAQTWQSTCDSTALSERIFRNDVSRLAVDRLYELNQPFKDSVEIPEIFKDSITKGLYAIYNMPSSPLKDTILTAFGYSNFDTTLSYTFQFDSVHLHHRGTNAGYASSIKRIELYIGNNGTNQWADSDWAAGNFYNTRDTQVNQFLAKYSLKVKQPLAGWPSYILTSPRAVNTTELAKRFLALLVGGTSTNSSNAFRYVGDGNTIDFRYVADGIIITFRNGCGDCPSGCTYGRYWILKVNTFTDCSVTYLKDSIFYIGFPPPNNVYTCMGTIVSLFYKSFSIELKNEKAQLYWDVSAENDMNYYAVEKSFNRSDFIEMGRVYATSANSLYKSYQWQDNERLSSNSFYRIKAVEKSGKVIYSKTVLLKAQTQHTSVSISPNPVIGKQLNVYYNNAAAGDYMLQLYTGEGKMVFSKKMVVNGSNSSYAVSLPMSIAKGTYVVKVWGANETNLLQQLVFIE